MANSEHISVPKSIIRQARALWEKEGKILPQYVYVAKVVNERNAFSVLTQNAEGTSKELEEAAKKGFGGIFHP